MSPSNYWMQARSFLSSNFIKFSLTFRLQFKFFSKVKIILIRHGEAEQGRPDSERNLTSNGRNDIRRLAALLKASDWDYKEVRHSPVLRARMTADILANTLGIPAVNEKRLSPGMDIEPMVDDILSECENVSLWVFHMPDIAAVASYFTGLRSSQLYIPPGSILALNVNPSLPSASMLIWALQPQILKG